MIVTLLSNRTLLAVQSFLVLFIAFTQGHQRALQAKVVPGVW